MELLVYVIKDVKSFTFFGKVSYQPIVSILNMPLRFFPIAYFMPKQISEICGDKQRYSQHCISLKTFSIYYNFTKFNIFLYCPGRQMQVFIIISSIVRICSQISSQLTKKISLMGLFLSVLYLIISEPVLSLAFVGTGCVFTRQSGLEKSH